MFRVTERFFFALPLCLLSFGFTWRDGGDDAKNEGNGRNIRAAAGAAEKINEKKKKSLTLAKGKRPALPKKERLLWIQRHDLQPVTERVHVCVCVCVCAFIHSSESDTFHCTAQKPLLYSITENLNILSGGAGKGGGGGESGLRDKHLWQDKIFFKKPSCHTAPPDNLCITFSAFWTIKYFLIPVLKERLQLYLLSNTFWPCRHSVTVRGTSALARIIITTKSKQTEDFTLPEHRAYSIST